ncbi:MFS general substrate transporter [Meredithblackwellia eburnea MCA 4105]
MSPTTATNSLSSFDKMDAEKQAVTSSGFAPASEDVAGIQIDPAAERALIRRLDRRLLPLIIFMYLTSALDRGNLGNAKTNGMTTDLHFGTNDYSLIQTVFYIPFCTLTVPGNALTKRFGPLFTLPTMMIGWGGMAAINAACRNSGQVMAVRVLLGMFEAGFAPGVIYTLTNFYRRDELGLRVAWFYVASPISGAVSGLISYGVFQIKGSLHGWQILFLIEGGATILIGFIAYFILPNSVASARFLNAEEKELCRLRNLQDSSNEISQGFNWGQFFEPVRDPMFYIYALIAICYGVPVASVGNWLPQVVARLGYNTLLTNALTVPPYVFGACFLFFLAWNSDRTHNRAYHLMTAMALTFIGFVILATVNPVKNHGVSLFAVFLLCSGAFVPSVLFHTWHNNNDPSSNGRAFRTAAMTFFANSGGLVSSNVFRQVDAPLYLPALYVNFSFLAVGLCLVLGLRTYMARENARRNREQGVNWTFKDVPTASLMAGAKSPEFRYFP